MIRVSGESKSRLVKAAGAESCGQRRNQKLHAAVARSTFWSQNAKKLRVSDHFLKFRCRKIARRCGEKKHVSRSRTSTASALEGTSSWTFSAFYPGEAGVEKILVPGRYPASFSGTPRSHLVSCKHRGPVFNSFRHLRVLGSLSGWSGILQLLRFQE